MKEEKSVLGLSTIRRNRGISLEQIADSTKIGIRSLEAIEQGDFRKLPGGIYNTSYIRQYARPIDYDECALIAFYKREMARSEDTASSGRNGNGTYGGFLPPFRICRSLVFHPNRLPKPPSQPPTGRPAPRTRP